jgi:hypothetical protein
MSTWKAVGVVGEGQAIRVGGLNPWEYEWREVPGHRPELPHPSYPYQRHSMYVFEVDGPNGTVRFAAGELSANVWGFYVPGP